MIYVFGEAKRDRLPPYQLKGLEIVLVVVGHLIQMWYLQDSCDSSFAFRVIYSFHMPLFFFMSGKFFRPRAEPSVDAS